MRQYREVCRIVNSALYTVHSGSEQGTLQLYTMMEETLEGWQRVVERNFRRLDEQNRTSMSSKLYDGLNDPA